MQNNAHRFICRYTNTSKRKINSKFALYDVYICLQSSNKMKENLKYYQLQLENRTRVKNRLMPTYTGVFKVLVESYMHRLTPRVVFIIQQHVFIFHAFICISWWGASCELITCYYPNKFSSLSLCYLIAAQCREV